MKDNPISTIDSEYIEWLKAIKQQIRSTKIRMIKTANTELIHFYWRLGQMISLKLKEQNWGDKVINKLSVDLRNEFPDMQGFSRQNLYYSKNFYEFYAEKMHISFNNAIVPQVEGQLQVADNYRIIFDIAWGHQKVISKRLRDAVFPIFNCSSLSLRCYFFHLSGNISLSIFLSVFGFT